MADFGDNFDDTEVDPAAEFLAREQDQLAGLEDELKPAVTPLTNGSTMAPLDGTGSFEMINTLGQTDLTFDPVSGGNELRGYVAPDPTFDFVSALAKGLVCQTADPSSITPVLLLWAGRGRSLKIPQWSQEDIPADTAPTSQSEVPAVQSSPSESQNITMYYPSPTDNCLLSHLVSPLRQTPSNLDVLSSEELSSHSASSKPVIREEPEKIKKWREEQKTRLEEKDANEEKKKAEMREAAKKELEEWYKHHEELIAKTKADNRNAEKQFVAEADAIEPGTEWERIAKLCDFNPKASRASKDVSRMRSIILQLKQNPPPQVAVKH